jgi:hypothetical protein
MTSREREPGAEPVVNLWPIDKNPRAVSRIKRG